MPRIVLKLPENGKTAESLSTLPRGNLPTMGREYPRNTRSASEGSIGVSVLLLRMQADISALSRRGGPGATKPEIAEVGSHMLGTGAKLSRHRRGDCDLWGRDKPHDSLAGCTGRSQAQAAQTHVETRASVRA